MHVTGMTYKTTARIQSLFVEVQAWPSLSVVSRAHQGYTPHEMSRRVPGLCGKLVVLGPGISKKVKANLSCYLSMVAKGTSHHAATVGSLADAFVRGREKLGEPMQEGFTAGGFEVKRTLFMGLGMFSLAAVKKGAMMIAAAGELLQKNETHSNDCRRYTWSPDEGDFVFSQWAESTANIVRYLNSSQGTSDGPNAAVVWVAGFKLPVVMALRDINANEQVLVDYFVDGDDA